MRSRKASAIDGNDLKLQRGFVLKTDELKMFKYGIVRGRGDGSGYICGHYTSIRRPARAETGRNSS